MSSDSHSAALQRDHPWLASAFCLLLAASLWSACEIADVGYAQDERNLDAELTAALTIDGQRKLSGFLLPESDNLASIPQDPANPLTPEKVLLGQLLFHETALGTSPRRESGRGTYGCATCHHAAAGFQAGRRQSIGEGGSGWGLRGEARRANPDYGVGEVDAPHLRSPTVLNSAYQEITSWSGSMGATGPNAGTESRWVPGSLQQVNQLGFEGVESQSIAALTKHRMANVATSIVSTDPEYRALWEAAFPGEPVSTVNAGLAMAAYQRTLLANRAPFQRWLRGDHSAMSDQEKRGALIFVGKAQCETCHTGPALNSMAFYALGLDDMSAADVIGRGTTELGRGGFLDNRDEDFKFKVPQLYNLVDSPFMGHGGSLESVHEVVVYYNDAIPQVSVDTSLIAPRFEPLHLTNSEIDDLVVFLEQSLRDPDLARYEPQRLPSGNCFPANDAEARVSLGC